VAAEAPEPALALGEFERLASAANGGVPVWRFGRRMRRAEGALAPPEASLRVPPDYLVQVGDELTVNAWGSIEGEWRLRVDRGGRVTLPRVGPVVVAGATAAELTGLLRARLERVFRGFELSAAVTDVSPLRVHVTGFVERPGDYLVPGLSTVSRALAAAEGPAVGGSFRRIRLERGGATVLRLDLYSLLGQGSRRDDRLLQSGDVVHVEAAGPQAAVLGSVNRVAVFELHAGETLADLLGWAGGFSPVAERGRVLLDRLAERGSSGLRELALPRDAAMVLEDGDIVRVLSQVDAERPSQRRNKRVRVEGEVQRPGDYLLPPGATLVDALAAAGGATAEAFVYGAELQRESVRVTQEANYERALQELEAEVGRLGQQRGPRDENQQANEAAARQLLARLRARRPEGRLVLDVTPDSGTLPALALEDGDRLRLPARSRSVGVFGSVFNAGSFAHDGARRLGDYLGRAGGPTGAADARSSFVVRANGSVLSARQGGWWNGLDEFQQLAALPGDTLFVPEKLDRVSWVQAGKDWTQILYQFGIGIAALLAIR
jgi:protein involved in polysaccharide export with SLBB domain